MAPRRHPSSLGGLSTTKLAFLSLALPSIVSALPSWELLPTNSTQQFRGLSALSDKLAWVSGTNATVIRTTDGGATWQSVGPSLSNADAALQLQFRDVESFSPDHAVVLSIGPGAESRVYATRDGGESWTLAFTNAEEAAFYDCLAFSSPARGFALSDPVDGVFRLIETVDGGSSWEVVSYPPLGGGGGPPVALEGEFAFSASGTCLTATPKTGALYAGSGGVGGVPGRVFRNPSGDGRRWEVANTTIPGGEGAGVFSVQFRDARRGIAVGGDYTRPNASDGTAAFSVDGGETWRAAEAFPGGYRSGASWVPGACGTAITVGPTGSDITVDGGKTWRLFDNGSFDAVQCLAGGVCWASGEKGRVARLTLSPEDIKRELLS